MFEIGSSLREARRKRGLELDAVQHALRIRRRYLEALENDQFELLPGEVYARGFLREYAEYLGLDSSLYVDEYNARFASDDEPLMKAQPTVPRLGPRPHKTVLTVSGLAAIVVAGAVVAWAFQGGHGTTTPPPPQTTPPVAVSTVKKQAPPAAKNPKPQLSHLTISAARGDCWLQIRSGSESGTVIYEQTLQQGQTIRFPLRAPLWIRFGAGSNVDATVDGKPVPGVPTTIGNLLVARS